MVVVSTEWILRQLTWQGYHIERGGKPPSCRFVVENRLTGQVHEVPYDPDCETEHEAAIRLFMMLARPERPKA
jgi:hypothetical protein